MNNSRVIIDNTCIKKSDQHVYYNVDIYNEKRDSFKIAEFQDYRSEPIIKEQGTYHVNLVRAKFPCSAIPINIFSVIYDPNPNQPDPLNPLVQIDPDGINYGAWAISFRKNNIYYTQHVIYIPNGSVYGFPAPKAPISGQYGDHKNPYYWVYAYGELVVMINNTFERLKILAGVADPAPYVVYEDGFFNLVVHANYMPTIPTYNGVEIFFNYDMRSEIMGGFNLFYDVTSTQKLFQLRLEETQYLTPYAPTVINTVPTTTPTYFKINQEYLYSPQYLSPLLKLIVTSATLKARSQLVQTTQSTLSSNNNNLKMLFSFSPDTTNPGSGGQSILNYYSSSFLENNIMDIQGTDDLNSVDFSIFWQDKFLNIYPLYIGFSQCVSLVFLFSKI